MSFDLSRVQALCFDVDGTLNNTDDQYAHKLAKWLHFLRVLFPYQDPLPFARQVVMFTETPAQHFFGLPDQIGLDHHINAVSDWFYRLGKKPSSFSIIPGIQEMLDTLQHRYPMSIVTARGLLTTNLFLNQYSLHTYFQAVATGLTCRHTKPYPDPVIWAARQMRVVPENCLMIGDTVVDILAGKRAGAQTVGVLCGFGTEVELRQAGADLVLEDTCQLTNILQND